MTEKPFSPESAETEALIQTLRERGFEDPEAVRLFGIWADKGQAEADRIDTPRANIEFNIKCATVFRAAGHMEAARDALESILVQADNEGEQDIYDEAAGVLREMDTESGG